MVSILNYAIKFNYLKENIASKVGNFSKRDYFRKVDFWTYNEFLKFMSVIDDKLYYTFFHTLYFTGMRQGETLALKWTDIENNYISINKTLIPQKSSDYIFNTPKTKASIRKIKIDDYTTKLLCDLKSHYKNIVNFNENWFVFGGICPLSTTTIQRKRDYYCKLSNVKKIRIHDFRHSHSSFLLSKGIPITLISQRLGHSNISMTLDIYSHLIPSDEDKAVNLINNLNKLSEKQEKEN